jgi:hypothetical protein
MSMVYKPVGGAILGVTIPIAIEYGAKGARIGATAEEPTKGFKWSGVIGTVLGIGEIGIAYAGHAKKIGWPKEDEDVALMAAMGGAKLATGVSILILDELRKRALYAFRKGKRLPITEKGEEGEGLEREEYPTTELVEEI